MLLLFDVAVRKRRIGIGCRGVAGSLPVVLRRCFQVRNMRRLGLAVGNRFGKGQTGLGGVSYGGNIFARERLLPSFMRFVLISDMRALSFVVTPCGRSDVHLAYFCPPMSGVPLFASAMHLSERGVLVRACAPNSNFSVPVVDCASNVSIRNKV